MNRELANKLLDKAREGKHYTFEQISAALISTGDLYDRDRSTGMEAALSSQGKTIRQSESAELVVTSEGRHHSDSWPGYSRYLDRRNEQTN